MNEPSRYDVIIIGSGAGGATMAWRMAATGKRVLVLERGSESGVQPDADIPNYNAAKAALIAFGKSISKAYAKDGVLVNSVSPAFIRTPLVERMLQDRADKKRREL